MPFKFTPTALEGVMIVDPAHYVDARGFFMESYSLRDFAAAGIDTPFVQDNHSLSRRGVVRGLHFQREHPQGKLVRVAQGRVLDVAVDIRPASATFGQWVSVELSGENRRQLYIPPGFAHGFLAIEEDTHLLYKCTEYYMPDHDAGIRWDDPTIGIDWRLADFGLQPGELVVSQKDLALPALEQILPT